jgi:alpha-1,6-mannosyltransferase
LSILALRRRFSAQHGHVTGALFTLLSAVQFHIAFYMSRTLPNSFAFIISTAALFLIFLHPYLEIVNFALAAFLDRKMARAIFLLAFNAIVFRFETALFASTPLIMM